MSKRLQVLLDEQEWRDVRRVARAQRITVAEWVRQALRAARRQSPATGVETKIDAIRRAARESHPTADIETMLAEIERGYLSGP
jgi:hypothetical protein